MQSLISVMDEIGIEFATIGYPGASTKVKGAVEKLIEYKLNQGLQIEMICAGRTVAADIQAIIDVSQNCGVAIDANLFIGSSPVRQYVEGWDLQFILEHVKKGVRFAVENGLRVCFLTEDTTRSNPEDLGPILETAIENGAYRIGICDTVGHSTPQGVQSILKFAREVVKKSNPDVLIDWHGHNDRGLALVNALVAVECGADRIHATALGIGERVGNTSIEQLLVNLKLMGYPGKNLKLLRRYAELVSASFKFPIPSNQPIFGLDAYRTGTGVHASAIIKAEESGQSDLADLVYTSVPARELGFEQIIEVGPMCGKSNVVYWLKKRGIACDDTLVTDIFEEIKRKKTVLTDREIKGIINRHVTG
ncbi:2-isopropylmalate synthase [Heliobacterium gestii]|nr:2-isopropylmalate synthase [Heliomicrobium gestii]